LPDGEAVEKQTVRGKREKLRVVQPAKEGSSRAIHQNSSIHGKGEGETMPEPKGARRISGIEGFSAEATDAGESRSKAVESTQEISAEGKPADVGRITGDRLGHAPESTALGTEDAMKPGQDRAQMAAQAAPDTRHSVLSTTGFREFQLELVSATRANLEAAFQYGEDLLKIQNMSDFIVLSVDHSRRGLQRLVGQVRDLVTCAQKLTQKLTRTLPGGFSTGARRNLNLNLSPGGSSPASSASSARGAMDRGQSPSTASAAQRISGAAAARE
jgi:Phasin protein